MQFQTQFHQNKSLNLVIGKSTIQIIKKTSLLLVGVGGIGCELLKNISFLPLLKLTIIDFDLIQISNLNRQFYFRQQHIKKPKSEIAKQQILKIHPLLNIQAITGSIYQDKYNNYIFYSQFDVIISALDNMKAREHLAKNATRFGKVLIDAGTSGFNGQSYSSIRYVTCCHNCYPFDVEDNYAVCSIRTRPQKSLHCALFAKRLYEQFFGDQESLGLSQSINQLRKELLEKKEFVHEQIEKLGKRLFDELFDNDIKLLEERLLTNGLQKIIFQDALKVSCKIDQQSQSRPEKVLKQQTKDIYSKQWIQRQKLVFDEDSIWQLKDYAVRFLLSFIKLAQRKISNPQQQIPYLIHKNQSSFPILPPFYQKDDQDCSLFVHCVTNLRIYNFKINQNQNPSFKFLTYYQTKKIIGKIIPAIASTNSISASLQTKQLVDIIAKSYFQPKYFTISPFTNQRISFSWLSLPNTQCFVCSPKIFYFIVKCNFSQTNFQQFQSFAQENCFSKGRDVYCQNLILIKNIKSTKVSNNKFKLLNFKKQFIIEDTLTLYFVPTTNISQLKIEIILINSIELQQSKQKKQFQIINRQNIELNISKYKQLIQKDKI